MTLRSLSLLALVVAAASCGPIEYLSQVSGRAQVTLARAQREGAATYAPYELTAATEYLREAREEASHSSYGPALEYGRRAEELADRALAITRDKAAKRGRRGAFDEQRPSPPTEEPPQR